MLEVSQSEFGEQVVEASKEVPVIVDFWSPSCGPCRVLGPILEQLEAESGGEWKLVKVNTDQNPQLATDFRIMSIPAVKVFAGGKVVDEFVGSRPKEVLQQWLQTIVPSETEKQLQAAAAAEASGDLDAAEAGYLAVVGVDADRQDAHLGLARIALERSDFPTAQEHLEAVPEVFWGKHGGAAERVWVRLEAKDLDSKTLAEQVESDETNFELRHNLALALAASDELDAALEHLLHIVIRNRDWNDDLAKRTMVRFFELFESDDPRVDRWRARLGRAMY